MHTSTSVHLGSLRAERIESLNNHFSPSLPPALQSWLLVTTTYLRTTVTIPRKSLTIQVSPTQSNCGLGIESEIDLQEQYDVRLEQGLDAFVVIDGLPVVPEDSKQKLIKYLLKKLASAGKTKEDATFMPVNDQGMTQGY